MAKKASSTNDVPVDPKASARSALDRAVICLLGKALGAHSGTEAKAYTEAAVGLIYAKGSL